MLVLGPWSNGHSILLMMNILKACIFHIPFKLCAWRRVTSKILCSLQQGSDPLLNFLPLLQRTIFGVIFEVEVLKLCPASWLSGVIGLAHQFWPIYNGSGEIANMDIIKFVSEGPRRFSIIDLELDIGGYPTIINLGCR